MTMRAAAMGVRLAQFHIDQIQRAVAYAALGDDLLGKFPYPLDRTLQHDGLDALIMIQVRMHGGHRQIVVSVLNVRQALR